MRVYEKLNQLKEQLQKMEGLVIGFSGGVDSTFLLKVAHEVLGDRAIAVTARSSMYPEREYMEAVEFVKKLNIKQIVIVSEELDIEGFSDNPVDRCYYCKNQLFTKISEIAAQNNIKYIADGSNVDDLGDYRPGMKALKELGVISPLREAGFTKEDIRVLSREMGLPTWDKQPFACLASRFPYGNKITEEKLVMIDKAEQYLMDLGFKHLRVRCHGDIARIEVSPSERRKMFNEELMDQIYGQFKKLGFQYTSLDLKGYRTGSMNEVIKKV
ncbi:MAG: ATP-dependent sacrificial sulfur transferase LarE [Clostridia bacterium]|nr:ATP-dependent sacrificial sulfur transferase LarE [Clostridia bacterium]